jgi:hypothetical protein
MTRRLLPLLFALLAAQIAPPARCADQQAVRVGWLSQAIKRSWPLSYLDQPPDDEGIQGARLGIADNNTTGRFTGQTFALVESVAPAGGDVAAAFHDLTKNGIRLVATDFDAPQLTAIAGLPDAAQVTILNTAAPDDQK